MLTRSLFTLVVSGGIVGGIGLAAQVRPPKPTTKATRTTKINPRSAPKSEAKSRSIDPRIVETELWSVIRNSRDPSDYEDYLKQYPNGAYKAVATAKLKELRATIARPAAEPPAVEDQVTSLQLGPGVQIEFVSIPAGKFEMGMSDSQSILPVSEAYTPHQVSLNRGFELGRYEVTQAQWTAVMGANPSQRTGGELPVTNVSWEDVQSFIVEVNKLDPSHNYRLPMEAEWEFACRAGTTSDYSGYLDAMAWYGNNSGDAPIDVVQVYLKDPDNYTERLTTNNCRVHPVGQKKPNAWGLFDMHGNVWEWCQDWYGPYPTGSVTDPLGPTSGSYRTYRSGSWYDPAANCRSAARGGSVPTYRANYLGFRVARTRRNEDTGVAMGAKQPEGAAIIARETASASRSSGRTPPYLGKYSNFFYNYSAEILLRGSDLVFRDSAGQEFVLLSQGGDKYLMAPPAPSNNRVAIRGSSLELPGDEIAVSTPQGDLILSRPFSQESVDEFSLGFKGEASELIGLYESPKYSSALAIFGRNTELRLGVPGQRLYTLVPRERDVYEVKEIKGYGVVVHRDTSRRVIGLLLRQPASQGDIVLNRLSRK